MAIIVATSFLASYLANWIELIFGLLDKVYEYIYQKNYPTEADTKEGDGATYTETTQTNVPTVRMKSEEII